MRIERTVTFGVIVSIGIIAISLTTFWLMQSAQAETIRERDALLTLLIIWVGGTAASILFLFVVIGEFIHRELAARGLTPPET